MGTGSDIRRRTGRPTRPRWFEDMDEDENRPYDMEEPNFFGLSIAYDPYMREVVQADRLTTCGGDGAVSYTHLCRMGACGRSDPAERPWKRAVC